MAAPKINGTAFEGLAAAIIEHDTEGRRAQYRAGNFPRASAVNDLDTRYRWDLYWLVRGNDILRNHAPFEAPDWHDAHIDTALRRIVKAL